MSTGRVLWIIWCLLWAGGWFFTGLITLVGVVVFWPLAILSALAILLPIGKPATVSTRYGAPCPACGALGDPARLAGHMQAVHGWVLPQLVQAPLPPAPMPPRGQVIEQRPYGGQPPVQQQWGHPQLPYPPR